MKLNYTLIFLLTFSTLFSQETSLKVTESKEFKDKLRSKRSNTLAIHTTEDGKTGLLRSDKDDFYTYVFNNQMDDVSIRKVKKENKETYQGHVSFGDEIKFITVNTTSKTKREVFCHSFNVKNDTYQKHFLFETKVEGSSLFNGYNKRLNNVVISPNGKYFAIATDNIKKNINAYNIKVYDSESLELVFDKDYNEHEDKNYVHNSLFVTNDATVYSLGKLQNSRVFSRSEDSKGNYTFTISKISKDDYISNTISLDDDNFISSLIINFHDGNLNLTGFYSEKKNKYIKGVCNFRLEDTALRVVYNRTDEIPFEIYQDFYRAKKAERLDDKKKEFSNYYIDHIINDDEGNLYIVAERFYVQSNMVRANGIGYTETTYNYDDIMIFKVDANAQLAWGRGIMKRALSPTYNAFVKNGNLHIILPSSKKLFEYKDGRVFVAMSGLSYGALYDFTFSTNGEVSYNKIQDMKKRTNYLPFYGTYDNGRFIMPNTTKSKRRFMILE